MLLIKSSILLLVAAATSVTAHPAPEAAIKPTTSTLTKRWSQISASLYSTTCGTNDAQWELNDDHERCINFDEGKDVYSISRSAFIGYSKGYSEPNCQGDIIYLDSVSGTNGCFAGPNGEPFKSFMIINYDNEPSQPSESAVAPAA
ncbi:hypothetical protein BJX70DRAFT_384847 [Aspergillus crustosus]